MPIYQDEDFRYDSDTGELVHNRDKSWRVSKGDSCPTKVDRYGYLTVQTGGKSFKQHRIAWRIVHGQWPEQIDHINGVRHDNRLCNLREVTSTGNNRNACRRKDNTSGVTGVSWSKSSGKWQATIRLNGRKKYLGLYDNQLDALDARKRAEIQHDFHVNHGRTHA